MRWSYCGHAMWLVEADGLRFVCDPLLGATHHAGVFEVVPRRTIDAGALRPDVLLVSHRHGDHFDVPSLHRLAQLDPDTVVLTPDALVAWAARALGFHDVRESPAGTLLAFEGVSVVTTPSRAPDEWGVMFGVGGVAAWNQVDSVFTGPDDIREVAQIATRALGARRLTMAAVRWQPMLEIAAQLGESLAFPYAAYDRLLHEIAAIDAAWVVPAAAGGAHVGAWAWLDRVVFPLGEARFLADLARRVPGSHGLHVRAGDRLHIDGEGVTLTSDAAATVVQQRETDDPRGFAPMSIPALVDANPGGHDVAAMQPRVEQWLHTELAPALAAAWPRLHASAPLRLAVDVVWPHGRSERTIVVADHGARVQAGIDPDWDALDQVAGSLLWEVIEGRRGWGDVLLAGALRARSRAYRIERDGLRRLPLGETFLYYALPYDRSHERATRHEVEQVLAAAANRP